MFEQNESPYKKPYNNYENELQPSAPVQLTIPITTEDHLDSSGAPQATPPGPLDLGFYRKYYSMTGGLVITRIIRSLTPWKRNFFESEDMRPDLYGPIWIQTTLMFLLVCMGNLSRYISSGFDGQNSLRVHHFRYAVLLVYTAGFGLPAILGLVLRFFQSRVTVVQLVCLYGYSMSCTIIVLVLCVIPSTVLHWLLMLYGLLNSTAFLLLNLLDEVQTFPPIRQYIIYGGIVVCQLTLFLMFKLIFFELMIADD